MDDNRIIGQEELRKSDTTKKRVWSPAILLFAVVIVFFIVQGIILLRHHSVSAYNIGIADSDNVAGTYRGLVLLTEETETAPTDGFITFFSAEGEWVSCGNYVMALDPTGSTREALRSRFYGLDVLSYGGRLQIQKAIKDALESYDSNDFSTISLAKSRIEEMVFHNLLKDGGEDAVGFFESMSLTAFQADQSGFFLNRTDGYESLTVADLTAAHFSERDYKAQIYVNGSHVKEGESVLSLVTDNFVTIAFLLTEDEARIYGQKTGLTIQTEDENRYTGTFSVETTADGKKMGVVKFQKYAGNFLKSRFVDFRILDAQVTGYKIPESAIIKKDMFVVPSDYITTGSEDNKRGVMTVKNGKMEFVSCTVYDVDKNPANNIVVGTDVSYIAGEKLEAGMTIQKPGGSPDKTVLSMVAPVEGVYQINSGYCVFKPIVRLQNSLDTAYVVISAGVKNGLKAYDRIVLNAENYGENEILFE